MHWLWVGKEGSEGKMWAVRTYVGGILYVFVVIVSVGHEQAPLLPHLSIGPDRCDSEDLVTYGMST